MENLKQRVTKALSAVLVATLIGTVGFWLLEGGRASVVDCLYMTIITLSTVGYGEVIPLTGGGRIFASLLIIFGMGTLIYFGSTVLAFWVELDLQRARRRKRMEKAIKHLEKHIIVCGVGTTGSHVVRELIDTQTPFVMIETDEERLREFRHQLDELNEEHHYIHGDATEDRVLEKAGIEHAIGLVAALPSDKDNLYLILSARQMNPALRIVSRATEKDAPPKMLRAGADRVVSPNYIGGMRIASELLRPQVVEFLDMMLRDKDQNVRIEQVQLPDNSPIVGKTLADTRIRKATDLLVIALRDQKGNYTYNPGPDTMLTKGSVLVVLGKMESVIRMREALGNRNHSVSLIP